MGALTTTDYATVSDGTKIYLYYQNDSNQIREVTSLDGSIWTENPDAVAETLSPGGSLIAAYYAAHDGTAGKKPSVGKPRTRFSDVWLIDLFIDPRVLP